jgi:F-type H+-transporting ATPase subunit a
VSLNVMYAHLAAGLGTAGSDTGEEFVAPGPESFWQPIIGDGAFAITRASIVLLVTVGVLGWFFLSVSRQLAVVPSKRQWMAEGVYNFVRNTIGRDVIGSRDFKAFVPLLFTLFTLILLNNVLGIVPFVQFPTLSRIGVPIALTAVVYVTYHIVGVRRKGGFLPWVKSMLPGDLPGWIVPLVFLLELLTFFIIRPVTLALRIFGNMFAGHLLLLLFALGGEYLLLHGSNLFLNFSGVISFLMVIVLTFFELLIAFLQAFIFALLTALYIAGAVAEEH